MARIAVAGFQHETNTFARSPATLADFEAPDAWPGLTRGAAVRDAVAGMNLPLAGAIEALERDGHMVGPVLWASAGPSAAVTRDAYERIIGMLLDGLAAAGRVDGVYLDLHGAMVAEHLADGDGETLRRVRAHVGGVPVVASLDLHANVSAQMFELADGLVAYRTYPHLDMAETGARAARHLSACFGGVRMARSLRPAPFLIPLPWQCTDIAPARGLYRRLAALEEEAAVAGPCTLSLAMGFPPADVPFCGAAVLAYGRTQAAVDQAVDTLAEALEAAEDGFAGRLWEPADAVAHAMARARTAERPIILADTQDNPGGGADSDGTVLLAELIRQEAEGAVLGLLFDPEAAAAAHAAGVGATLPLALGAKSGYPGNAPFAGTFRIEAVGDGRVAATGPFYRGSRMQLGPMALLSIDGVRVAVASRKQQAADQAMFRHLGVEPSAARILALKSSVHFRADFAALAEDIVVVRAPGPNVADPAELPYERLRPGVRLRPCGPAFGGGR